MRLGWTFFGVEDFVERRIWPHFRSETAAPRRGEYRHLVLDGISATRKTIHAAVRPRLVSPAEHLGYSAASKSLPSNNTLRPNIPKPM